MAAQRERVTADASSATLVAGRTAPPPLANSVALVRALQMGAGNAAVSRVLSNAPYSVRVRTNRAPRLRAPKAVLRHGLTVVVKRSDDNPPRIVSLLVLGRPENGMFASREGLHTTPWASLVDSVRRATVGRPLDQAIQALRGLFDAVVAEHSEPRAQFDDAKKDALAALADGEQVPSLQALQRAITAYLTFRNLAAGAVVDLGAGQAVASGERPHLELVRQHEADESGDPDKLRRALWELLDPRTLAHLASSDATPKTAPGTRTDDKVGRVVDVLRRHLQEMTRAYPLSYRAAGLGEWESVEAFLTAARMEFLELQTLDQRELKRRWNNVKAPEADRAPAGWSRTKGQPAAHGVQIELDDDGDEASVAEVNLGIRPLTLMGVEQGSHVTAYSVFEQQVRTCLTPLRGTRPSLLAAGGRLRSLCADVRKRPSVQALLPAGEEHQPPPGKGSVLALPGTADPKARQIFEKAVKDLDKAEKAWDERLDDADSQHLVDLLQDLAAAFLGFRSALPLTAILTGLAKTGREARAHACLRAAEADEKAFDFAGHAYNVTDMEIIDAMWDLLDLKAFRWAIHDADAMREQGASADAYRRAIDMLHNHFLDMVSAYPSAWSRVHFRDATTSVLPFLRRVSLDLPDVGVNRALAVILWGACGISIQQANALLGPKRKLGEASQAEVSSSTKRQRGPDSDDEGSFQPDGDESSDMSG